VSISLAQVSAAPVCYCRIERWPKNKKKSYVKGLNVAQRHKDLPAAGIYMKYEFTPFRVKWIVSYKSFAHFLTSVCAILGGIYAFAGMVDNILYRTTRHWGKHRSPGKARGGEIQL